MNPPGHVQTAFGCTVPPVPLPGGYQVIVPEARPLSLVSGTNWEGSGVVPDVRGGDDSLFVARSLIAAAVAGDRTAR